MVLSFGECRGHFESERLPLVSGWLDQRLRARCDQGHTVLRRERERCDSLILEHKGLIVDIGLAPPSLITASLKCLMEAA